METIVYDKPLFFKKEFKFRNKRSYNDFFNNALMESSSKFIELTKREFDQNIHIIYSWSEYIDRIAYIILGIVTALVIFKCNPLIELTILGSSILFYIISKLLKIRLESIKFSKSFIISAYENLKDNKLEEVRQELIQQSK